MSDSIQVQALQNRNKELENRIKELESQLENQKKEKENLQRTLEEYLKTNSEKKEAIREDKFKVERLVGGAYRVFVEGKVGEWTDSKQVTKIELSENNTVLMGNPDIGWVVGRSVTCQEDRV